LAQRGGAARPSAGFDVAGVVTYGKARTEVKAVVAGGSEQQSRFWFAAATAIVWSVTAAVHTREM
jgi:hypothetical protein